MLAEYYNWSDSHFNTRESEEGKPSYADVELMFDDPSDDVIISLTRNTKTRKNFFMIVDGRKLYEFLKSRYED